MGFPSYFESIVERLIQDQESLRSEIQAVVAYNAAPPRKAGGQAPKRPPRSPLQVAVHFEKHLEVSNAALTQLLELVTSPQFSNASAGVENEQLRRSSASLEEQVRDLGYRCSKLAEQCATLKSENEALRAAAAEIPGELARLREMRELYLEVTHGKVEPSQRQKRKPGRK
jgi:chromosome segregation ATPase